MECNVEQVEYCLYKQNKDNYYYYAASSIRTYFSTFIYSFHMLLFVFVSGYVFNYCISCGKYGEFIPFIKNKAKRLLIPYLLVGTIIVVLSMSLLKLTDMPLYKYIMRVIILGEDNRHLWYLQAFFLLYILTWGMVNRVKGTKKYVCLLIFAFGLMILADSR